MTIDLTRARQETPGCAYVNHLNNAGAALMPQPVINAVANYYELESQIGGYEAARDCNKQIERVYDSVAALMDCQSTEIAIVENATRAWDMAFYSIPLGKGDRILTCVSDYASNFIPFLQVSRKTGAQVDVIPNDEHGQVSIEALENMIDSSVKLIAITHVPTNGGLVNPAQKIGVVARRHNILYLLDACQSVGQMPVSVADIGCDMLSTTSRKFLRGPRGMGFLYVRSSLVDALEPPFLDLHAARWTAADSYEIRSDARRFENWETNYSAKVGLGVAVDYALQWGVGPIWERVQMLANSLRENLSNIPGVTSLDLGETRCGIVSFSLKNWDAGEFRVEMTKRGINVWVATAQDTLIDMNARGLDSFTRVSVHYYNSEKEIEQFSNAVAELSK